MITCIRTFFVPNLKTYRRPKTKMTPPVDLIIIMYKPMLPITIPRNYLNCAFSDSSTINLFDTFNPAFSFRPPEFGQEAQPALSPTQSTYRRSSWPCSLTQPSAPTWATGSPDPPGRPPLIAALRTSHKPQGVPR